MGAEFKDLPPKYQKQIMKKTGVTIPKAHDEEKKSKYNNKKTTIDGITFDSKRESVRYSELKLLERAGEIKGLELQPRFELQPPFTKNGKKYRKIEYVADFRYTRAETGETVVEDPKGYRNQLYKTKKKIFEYKYPELTITEI